MERNLKLNSKCSILFLCFTLKLVGQNYFATNLNYGNYNIGYDIINTIDLSRHSLNKADEKLGRSMTINIWYPSKKNPKPMMPYKDYIYAAGKNNIDQKKKYLIERIGELSGDTLKFIHQADVILNSITKAQFRAPIIDDTHFVIVFPDLPYAQSIMCEYLASHGFVVVSPVIKGTFQDNMEYNIRGIETGVKDLEFCMAYIRSNYKVYSNYAVMGLGFNASVALALYMRNTDIACYISLEGGITTKFENDLIEHSPYFDIEKCNRPMLIINAPHPDVDTKVTLKYKYANKIYQHFFQSSEFYFLNYGVWEQHIGNIFPNANKGHTLQSFEEACRSVKIFMDIHLKHQLDELNYFKGVKNDLFELNIVEACAIPLSSSDIFDLIQRLGMNEVIGEYDGRRTCDAQPFSYATFYKTSQLLLDAGKNNDLLDWCGLYNMAFLKSSMPNYFFGRAYQNINNRDKAKEYYHLAISYLDTDVELSQNEINYFKTKINQLLDELK